MGMNLLLVAVPVGLVWTPCSLLLEAIQRTSGLFAPSPLPEVDMSDRVVIITGANTGVGRRTSFHLARLGAKVIMACRSVQRGEDARAALEEELRTTLLKIADNSTLDEMAFGDRAKSGDRGAGADASAGRSKAGSLQVMHLDLADLRSVRHFAKEFKETHGRLDVLVNNAGLQGVEGNTADGLGMVYGVNFLGHFVLTTELMPLIQSTPKARVVCLSSVTHHFGGTNWEDAASGDGRPRSRSEPYSSSKLAMVLFAKELRRRFKASGSTATAFAVNPGSVRSDIWRTFPGWVLRPYDLAMRALFLNTDQGSHTSVSAAALPLEELSGDYFQPYWAPFGLWFPFEIKSLFVGCAPLNPSVPKDEVGASRRMWTTCERIVEAADAARGMSH